MKTAIDKKRFKKILRRRKLKAHKDRVGPLNYYADRVNIICVQCGETRKLHQMTAVGGGLGIGQCKFCVIKMGITDNEKEQETIS